MSQPHLKRTFPALSVDAGNISVYCSSLKTNPKAYSTEAMELGEPGTYPVIIEAKTWRGPTRVAGNITTGTGTLMVGDACYGCAGDGFHTLIDRTESLSKPIPELLPLNTGGDGTFAATVTVGKKIGG